MTAIASPQNPRLQGLRRLHRRRERARSGRFLAEGEDLIAAAGDAGWEPLEGYRVLGSEFGEGFLDVQPAALAAVSTLGSGARAIAVYEERWSAALAGPLWIYLHGLSDPGNVGTIVRAAHAFGASGVALGPDCADPFSPKAVRASMGAIFAVALARVARVADLPGERIALVAHAGEALREFRPRAEGALTLLVGAERAGLPSELVAACEHVVHIPIAGDSLNAAMAATVALYEMSSLKRQGARLAGGTRPEGPGRPAAPPTAPPSKVRA
jgi:TrmH family RNA methyltransferase